MAEIHFVATCDSHFCVTSERDCLPADSRDIVSFSDSRNALACAAARCKVEFDRDGHHTHGLEAEEYDVSDVADALAYVYGGSLRASLQVQELLADRC